MKSETALQQYTAQIDATLSLKPLNAENKMTLAEAEALQGLLAANQVDLKALAGGRSNAYWRPGNCVDGS